MAHTLWINIDWITIYAVDIFPTYTETIERKKNDDGRACARVCVCTI